MNNSELIVNHNKNRFEFHIDNHIAFIDYSLTSENVMHLTHTEVPKELEGKGIGKNIVEKSLCHIKEQNYTVAPKCPFIVTYLNKHPEWRSILADGYSV